MTHPTITAYNELSAMEKTQREREESFEKKENGEYKKKGHWNTVVRNWHDMNQYVADLESKLVIVRIGVENLEKQLTLSEEKCQIAINEKETTQEEYEEEHKGLWTKIDELKEKLERSEDKLQIAINEQIEELKEELIEKEEEQEKAITEAIEFAISDLKQSADLCAQENENLTKELAELKEKEEYHVGETIAYNLRERQLTNENEHLKVLLRELEEKQKKEESQTQPEPEDSDTPGCANTNPLPEILEAVEDVKGRMPEGQYLMLMNILGDLHNGTEVLDSKQLRELKSTHHEAIVRQATSHNTELARVKTHLTKNALETGIQSLYNRNRVLYTAMSMYDNEQKGYELIDCEELKELKNNAFKRNLETIKHKDLHYEIDFAQLEKYQQGLSRIWFECRFRAGDRLQLKDGQHITIVSLDKKCMKAQFFNQKIKKVWLRDVMSYFHTDAEGKTWLSAIATAPVRFPIVSPLNARNSYFGDLPNIFRTR